jgi:aerobic carbon-monoxide dehydrogenase small subunit
MQVTRDVNGDEVSADIEPRTLLVHYVRDHLGLTGTHWGCDTSNCGTCVVHMDGGEPVKSCTVLAAMADGHERHHRRGPRGPDGELDPVQQGFMECHGLQCGFCTPGMMMTARWLLDRNPDPTEAEIREAISGQICRCTGYDGIVKAIQWAAAQHRDRAGTRAGRCTGMTVTEEPPSPPARRGTPSASAACSARRTCASCAARATTSTT